LLKNKTLHLQKKFLETSLGGQKYFAHDQKQGGDSGAFYNLKYGKQRPSTGHPSAQIKRLIEKTFSKNTITVLTAAELPLWPVKPTYI